MKFLIFNCLFLISFSIIVSSKSLINQNDLMIFSTSLNDERPLANELIDFIDANLTTIENDLIKKGKQKEAIQVKLNREHLTGQVRENFTKAFDFLEEYKKYVNQNSRSFAELSSFKGGVFIWNENVTDWLSFLIDDCRFFLKRIEKELIKQHMDNEGMHAFDSKVLKASIAREIINTFENDVKTVVEESDDLLEEYLPSPYDEPVKEEIETEKMMISAWLKDIVSKWREFLERIEKVLRKDKKIEKADEVKAAIDTLNEKLVALEMKAFDFMYKYPKYWHRDPIGYQKLNLNDACSRLFLMMIRFEPRIMKKCIRGLIKDNKIMEAEKALRLKLEISEKVVPVFETVFYLKDRGFQI